MANETKKKKMSIKQKNILLTVLIIMFVLIVVAATYAYFTLSVEFSNNKYSYGTECFNVVYSGLNDDGTTDITGALVPSATPLGGLSGKLSIGVDPSCDVLATGEIFINLKSDSDRASTLIQPVEQHCYEPKTLEVVDYGVNNCAINGYSWAVGFTALKYAVYRDDETIPISVGYINRLDQIIRLYGKFPLSHKMVNGSWKPVDYNIYIWLDGNLSDNSYASISLEGSISADIVQEPETTYAVYSADDNSLRFYNTNEVIREGSTYNGRTATAVYMGLEDSLYSNGAEVPWVNYAESITKVVVEDEIAPENTAYWFHNMRNVTEFEISNLDTSNVKSMAGMFYYFCTDVTTLAFDDINNLDVSNVTDMRYMFASSAQWVTTLSLDLSGWKTSNVTNMVGMFSHIGRYSTNWSIGDLSGWDTSNVTGMSDMFAYTATTPTSFSIGDIGGWNTSKVTRMDRMFLFAGYGDKSWRLDLRGWDVSRVISYERFNESATSKVIPPVWVN